MDTDTISVTYKKKEELTKESKSTKVIIGLTMLALAIFSLIKGLDNYLVIFQIILAISQFALVLWGKELSYTQHSLEVSDKKLIINNNSLDKVIIEFNTVKRISTLSIGFKISFEDSVKFITIPWLTSDQAQMLKDKLVLIARQNNFDIN